MAQKINTSMPDSLDLAANWQVVVNVFDPSTGDAVTGVTFSDMALIVDQVSDSPASALAVGPFKLIPLDELNSG